MSDFIETGGPAFPLDARGEPYPIYGMTLRDWFAGQALVSMNVNMNSRNPAAFEDYAASAYACADAMLAARKVSP